MSDRTCRRESVPLCAVDDSGRRYDSSSLTARPAFRSRSRTRASMNTRSAPVARSRVARMIASS